ncbi:glycosyltransferase [Sulfitobacter sp.]|mgnify:CR=1 FL=1|uniref:glycosyltransferase n=1 Tax=Sulfitobacter sp. TaxID=1903071 RepID=UPI002604EA29|nr:glycosyltransferase [Sulfitobacter sp.]
MTRLRVVHLVDDTTAGGVMRVLDYITTAPDLAKDADHRLRSISRSRWLPERVQADVVVSNLAISWRALPMLMALRLMHPRTKVIHVEHSYTEQFVAVKVAHKKRFATLICCAYRLFDKVVAVSHGQADWLKKSGAVKPQNLSVIQSCVDLSNFRKLPPPNTPLRVIGAIGRLDEQKGFDLLIKAFRQTTNPNIALHVYGEGAEKSKLQRLAKGDPRIEFKGFAADPVTAMAAVDVVAMPSRWEAYGLVAIEALAAKRLLLVNGIDGLRDHLENGAQAATLEGGIASWQQTIERLTVPRHYKTTHPDQPKIRLEDNYALSWSKLLHSL